MEPMKLLPAANLDQRICIQVRGQNSGEKSSALEAVPHPPQDQPSCRSPASEKLFLSPGHLVFPAFDFRGSLRTFEAVASQHGGGFGGGCTFPLGVTCKTRGLDLRVMLQVPSDPQLWLCAVRILILEVPLCVVPVAPLSVSCRWPRSAAHLSCLVHLPLLDFRVRWAGCVTCAFH